ARPVARARGGPGFGARLARARGDFSGSRHRSLAASGAKIGSKELTLLRRGAHLFPEVLERLARRDAAARRATEEPLLQEIRLINVFHRVARLRERGRDRFDADRTAVVVVD